MKSSYMRFGWVLLHSFFRMGIQSTCPHSHECRTQWPNHNRQWGFKESQSYAALCVLWQRAPVVIKVFCQFIHEYQALVWMNELSHTLFQSCTHDTLILTRSAATVTPQKWTHTLTHSTSHKKGANHIHSFRLCSSIIPLSFPARFLLATYTQDSADCSRHSTEVFLKLVSRMRSYAQKVSPSTGHMQ